jgi:hypothetical protein
MADRGQAVLSSFAQALNVPSPDAAMRVAARRLLETCGVTSVPVPLTPICEHLGIPIVRKRTQGLATLRVVKGGFELWVDPRRQVWRRERFSIAHELAHVLLMTTVQDGDLNTSAWGHSQIHTEVERLCDIGASELLMPTRAITDAVENRGLSQAALQSFYDTFLVSYRALLFRLAHAVPSSAVILWKRYSRGPHEPAALRVLGCYPGYRQRLHSPWLPRGATTRHITPDIVSDAIESCQSVYGEDLKLELHKVDECRGIACILPRSRVADSQLPLFEGGVIPDEDRLGVDAFLLASPKSMSDGMRFWKKIREVSA